jgi:hypothetical protein
MSDTRLFENAVGSVAEAERLAEMDGGDPLPGAREEAAYESAVADAYYASQWNVGDTGWFLYPQTDGPSLRVPFEATVVGVHADALLVRYPHQSKSMMTSAVHLSNAFHTEFDALRDQTADYTCIRESLDRFAARLSMLGSEADADGDVTAHQQAIAMAKCLYAAKAPMPNEVRIGGKTFLMEATSTSIIVDAEGDALTYLLGGAEE